MYLPSHFLCLPTRFRLTEGSQRTWTTVSDFDEEVTRDDICSNVVCVILLSSYMLPEEPESKFGGNCRRLERTPRRTWALRLEPCFDPLPSRPCAHPLPTTHLYTTLVKHYFYRAIRRHGLSSFLLFTTVTDAPKLFQSLCQPGIRTQWLPKPSMPWYDARLSRSTQRCGCMCSLFSAV